MYRIHTTHEGDQMMICEMTNSHLINMIKLFIRKVNEVVGSLNQAKPMTEYERALYGVQTASPTDAAAFTRTIADRMAPYVMEATVRGLEGQFIEELRKAFSRTTEQVFPFNRKSISLLPRETLQKLGVTDPFDDIDMSDDDDEFLEADPEEGDR